MGELQTPAAPPVMAPSVDDEHMVSWLAAVVGHVNQHPTLGGTVNTVQGYQASVHVGRSNRPSKLEVFAAWVRSLSNVTLVRVGSETAAGVQLTAHGDLADGTRASVTCVVSSGVESDLLAANTPVCEGATFPSGLLLRLVDHVVVEAVAKPKVTQREAFRYFRDAEAGAKWRVYPDGFVEHWIGDGWIESVTTLDRLVGSAHVVEVGAEQVTR